MSWFPTDNFRSPAALSRFLLVAIVGVALDLWTKSLAVKHLAKTGDTIQFIPGWLHFHYTTNEGAVFGLGQGQRVLFVTVSALAIGFLFYLFATARGQRIYQVVLGMLLAGVIGNLYDRLVLGHVRDMIHALPGWIWPFTERTEVFPWIFNIADVLLCVGVFLVVVWTFFQGKGEVDEKSESRNPAMKSE